MSSDNRGISLDNGRNFIVSPNDQNKLIKWSIGGSVKLKVINEASPFSYFIEHQTNGEVIQCGNP